MAAVACVAASEGHPLRDQYTHALWQEHHHLPNRHERRALLSTAYAPSHSTSGPAEAGPGALPPLPEAAPGGAMVRTVAFPFFPWAQDTPACDMAGERSCCVGLRCPAEREELGCESRSKLLLLAVHLSEK